MSFQIASTAARRIVLAASFVSLAMAAMSTSAATVDQSQIERGRYLANAGDCVACHTAVGGQPYAGGLMMKTPFGEISTPNITPDNKTGIGAWTDEQFYRAMHDGIGRHGEYLYPVMPFPWYTRVAREDVMAIRAYLATVPAVSKPRVANQLSFPASVRSSLLVWRKAFFKPGFFVPDPQQSAQVNRGDYLVNGLAHCGECHNGRQALGATTALRQPLQGGVIDNWYAPNITSDLHAGIGNWSNQAIATYLKTGVSPDKGVALGPMAQTVHSLSQLTDEDLLSIAAYLKTTPAKTTPDVSRPLYAGADARGGGTYLDYCASCHQPDGQGLDGVIPALKGNGAVTAGGPQNVIRAVLGGLQARGHYAPMPAIGADMTDEQVAEVTNYVRQNWGNAAAPTALPGMVAEIRHETDSPMSAGSQCAAVGSDSVAKVVRQGEARSLLDGLTDGNMPTSAQRLVQLTRSATPAVPQDRVVNGLTAAYCGVLQKEALSRQARATRLGHFAELVYAAAAGHTLR